MVACDSGAERESTRLTMDQEEVLLAKYEGFVYGIALQVRRVMDKRDIFTLDDLLQEGRIALLRRIRSIEDEKKILLSKKSIRTAMFAYARSMAPVYIPIRKFSREIGRIKNCNYFDISGVPASDSEDEIIFMMMYKQFLLDLTREDRLVFQMKAFGYTGRQIMTVGGYAHELIVSRIMKRLRERFTEAWACD